MSRPHKTGLDYFSFDVDFFEDQKIEFLSAKYGEYGELVAIKLLAKIYRHGYYLPWGEDECLLFSKKAGEHITSEFVDNAIKELVKRGFFDKRLYDKYCILTSNGIQKRYFKAVERRKGLTAISEYITDKSFINDDINLINVDISTQSKVKERKVKESKVNSVVQKWNSMAAENGLPIVKAVSGKRKKQLNTRLKEKQFADNYEFVLSNITNSSFLKGNNSSNWGVTFDWIIKDDTNYVKILEGAYKDKPTQKSKTQDRYERALLKDQEEERKNNETR